MRLPLTFETQYTREDFRAVQRYLVGRGLRKQRAARLLVVAAIVAIFLGLGLSRPRLVTSQGFVTGMGLVFLVLVSLVLLSRRLCQPAEGGAFLQPHSFEFDDEGIRISSREREGFHRWTGIRSWASTSTHLFLLIDENAAIAVPRRCFGGRNEEEDLRELIRAKTSMESLA